MSARDNLDEMILMRKSGMTLQEVSEVFGITRERVRQLTKGVKRPKIVVEKPRKPTREEVFWSLFDKTAPNGCWVWQGYRHPNGYGIFGLSGDRDYIHRLAWKLTHGPIPDGLHVCHHCDTPICGNPEHLFLGTPADNMHDRDAKGRGYFSRPDAVHGRQGENHPFAKLTTEQVAQMRFFYGRGLARQIELSRIYGVSDKNVSSIIRGKTWTHIPGGIQKTKRQPARDGKVSHGRYERIPQEVIAEMRYFYNRGLARQAELCRIYGVSDGRINEIVHYKCRRDVPDFSRQSPTRGIDRVSGRVTPAGDGEG